MKVWKTLPSWFRLDNYDESKNFTAVEWCEEIFNRVFCSGESFNVNDPDYSFLESELFEQRRALIEHIKNHTFFSNRVYTASKKNDEVEAFVKSLEPELHLLGVVSVGDLTENAAYSFLFGSDKKEEIEKDFSELYDDESEVTLSEIKRRMEIRNKYRGSINDAVANAWTNLYGEAFHDRSRYITVDLDASDEQISKDFKNWLTKARSKLSRQFLKREFTEADFRDWYESRLLPYWDLTEIAKSENATIPFHILGTALFPNEYGVDLTERVRKVTKRKCQEIISFSVMQVLSRQSAQMTAKLIEDLKKTE